MSKERYQFANYRNFSSILSINVSLVDKFGINKILSSVPIAFHSP